MKEMVAYDSVCNSIQNLTLKQEKRTKIFRIDISNFESVSIWDLVKETLAQYAV